MSSPIEIFFLTSVVPNSGKNKSKLDICLVYSNPVKTLTKGPKNECNIGLSNRISVKSLKVTLKYKLSWCYLKILVTQVTKNMDMI